MYKKRLALKYTNDLDDALDSTDLNTVNNTLNQLKEQKREYSENIYKKYILFFFMGFVGLILGIVIPGSIDRLNHANYNRASLDNIMKDLLG